MDIQDIATLLLAVGAMITAGTTWLKTAQARNGLLANVNHINVNTSLDLVRALRDQVQALREIGSSQMTEICTLRNRIESLEVEVKRANLYVEQLSTQLRSAQLTPGERKE